MGSSDFNDMHDHERVRRRVEWGMMVQPPEGRGNATGKPPEKPPFIAPQIVSSTYFRETEPPEREWLVPDWIPANDVSLLGADGGTGKTLIGIQLGVSCETGSLWLGMKTMDCPVAYYGAEEPWSELHIRYRDVSKPIFIPPIHPFELISVADREDAALVEIGESGKPEPTQMLGWLETVVKGKGIRLLVLDAAADVCAINENDRNQVRRAVAILRGFAIRNRCAILLLSHPSVEGMKSGRGYSGSTHWNNAVRARMYFTAPMSDEGDEIDPDARILSLEKANRARKGKKLHLRWKDGRFVLDEINNLESHAALTRAKEMFIVLLKKLHKQGRKGIGVNQAGKNYAPRVFEKHPDADGIKAKLFERAMEHLFEEELIRVVREGPPSKVREYIALSDKYYT